MKKQKDTKNKWIKQIKIHTEKVDRKDIREECKYYNNGGCKKGESCDRIHKRLCPIQERTGKCNDKRCELGHSKICRYEERHGECNREGCRYLHSIEKLRGKDRNDRYKRNDNNRPQRGYKGYRSCNGGQ